MGIGYGTYGHPVIPVEQEPYIEIGKYCSIAPGLQFNLGQEHRTDFISTYPHGGKTLPEPRNIVVGNDVWIGEGVTLMGGCRIGDGAVIGAYSILRGHIPPYHIAYGHPCRPQRRRFKPKVIRALLELKWWDFPPEKVKELRYFLNDTNLTMFFKEVKLNGLVT